MHLKASAPVTSAGRDGGDIVRPRAPSDPLTTLVIAAACLIHGALAYYQLSRPDMLFGVTGIDDGAYFGTAVRLVHGIIPYHQFVAVHPPGMALLLSPIAALSDAIGTRDGMALCRLLLPLVGMADVALVGLIVRHRGRLATLVACAVFALQPDVLVTEHTIELEPVLVLFCLLGAHVVFRGDEMADGRRLVWGGVLFGLAGAVKVWAVFPVAVLAVLCIAVAPRRLVRFGAGVVGGFLVPCAFFIAVDPGAFFHDVVVAQVGRVGGARVPVSSRLVDLAGIRGLGPLARYPVEVSVVLAAMVAAAFLLRRRRIPTLEWFALGSTVLLVVVFVLPQQFFSHYATFFAPFLALTLGLAVDRLVRSADLTAPLFAVVTVLALGLAVGDQGYISIGGGVNVKPPFALTLVDAVVPAGACVLADNPSIPIMADRFVPRSPGCTPVADPFGTSIAEGTGAPIGNGSAVPPHLVQVWLDALHHADYVVLDGPAFAGLRIPLVAPVTSYLDDAFQLVVRKPGQYSGLLIYARIGYPTGAPHVAGS